jgi:hypothetical protein
MNTRKTTIRQIAEDIGKTPAYVAKLKYGKYVRDRRIDVVENYDKACSEDFEHWVLHHRKESEKTAKELIDAGQYYYVDPKELIWLTESEHEEVHREINKLPWRVKLEEERRRKLSEAQKKRFREIDWTAEMCEERANIMKNWWTDEHKREFKERCAQKRENGENLVNIEQLDGKEGYRQYQREYRKIHYQRNKQAWRDYVMQNRYDNKSTEELWKLLEQKQKNFTYLPEKKQRLIDMIKNSLRKRGINPDLPWENDMTVEQIKEELERLNRLAHERGL